MKKNTFYIKNHAKPCTILRGQNLCNPRINFNVLSMTKWIMWNYHFQGSKWPTKWLPGFNNCPLPSLVWEHMVMAMKDMCSIPMGCGLMILISQLGPYCSYFKIWKKLQFVSEKPFWKTLCKTWFALQDTNN